MAGIVASTLRRKAFYRGGTRSSEQNKVAMAAAAAAAAMATDGNAASCSPSASRRSSRSSSFAACRPGDDERSACTTQVGWHAVVVNDKYSSENLITRSFIVKITQTTNKTIVTINSYWKISTLTQSKLFITCWICVLVPSSIYLYAVV